MTDDPGELVSLRQYLERLIEQAEKLNDAKFVTYRALIDSQAEKVALALTASEKAITKAETAAEKRFESVNEFRGQLTDQAATFITRREFEQWRDSTQERVNELKARVDVNSGRARATQSGWGYMIAAATVGVGVLSVVIFAVNAYFGHG